MKKVFILLLVLIMLLAGCSTEKLDSGNVSFYLSDGVYVFVDKETGVNYLIYNYSYRGGMTVRLNADGSPYISEVNR